MRPQTTPTQQDQAAPAGLNIYLVSRTEAKLTAAAEEIKAAYGVETKIFVADLVAAGALADAGAAWFGLKSNLDGLDVGVLVNNAGMSYDHPEFLHNVDTQTLKDIISINAVALTQMVHVVLPGMKERGRGCVVNISSGVSAALPACPLLAVYAASKAYVDALTAALAAEYSHFGIRFQVRAVLALVAVRLAGSGAHGVRCVQCQAPAFVATKMAKMRRTSLMVPSPAAWVAAAMTHVGREPRAFPYPVHALLSCAPSSCRRNMVAPFLVWRTE